MLCISGIQFYHQILMGLVVITAQRVVEYTSQVVGQRYPNAESIVIDLTWKRAMNCITHFVTGMHLHWYGEILAQRMILV